METLDSIDLFSDSSPKSTRGGYRPGAGRKPSINHGGAREGAGRKPAGYEPPPEKIDYDKAKARSEAAKADLAELEYKVKSKQYVDRATVVQVNTTAYATIAQTLRSIPDNLERKGVTPETCEMIGVHIDDALNDLAIQFEALAKQGEDEGDDDE